MSYSPSDDWVRVDIETQPHIVKMEEMLADAVALLRVYESTKYTHETGGQARALFRDYRKLKERTDVR